MDEALREPARRLAEALASGQVHDKESLQDAKRVIANGLRISLPSDADLAASLPEDVERRYRSILRTKPARSRSGVAVVAVMSSPAGCPHGKCIFCPGGPEVDAPQSYTGFEPSTMRARRHGYDPAAIVRGRLAQLERNGHAIDKVDIVVQGGTFPAREAAYQDWFIAGIYAGLNAGPDDAPDQPKRMQSPLSDNLLSAGSALPVAWAAEAEWAALPSDERRRRLDALMLANESAACRAIGLTIETKPDWCFESDLDRMLGYGATRVEVGLQALDDEVLRRTHRGHTLADSAKSLQLARDAGFKVCVHMMPGLPRGRGKPTLPSPGSASAGTAEEPNPWATNAQADVDDMRRLFAEEAWRPDMLKIYPCLVVMEGETPLKRLWQEGKYVPLDTAAATIVAGEGKGFVPPWCRIQRIDRDIPTTHVEAGVKNSNLRQLAQQWRAAQGLPECKCIRCREVGSREAAGIAVSPERVVVVRRDYRAAGGDEAFLAFEDPLADALVAFIRIRRTGADAHRPELRGAAVVRELKVYGTTLALADDPEAGAWQHRGLGARLLAEAERIAFTEWGVPKVAVLAGPGVKEYYRKHGYADDGPYVAKAGAGTHHR
ncbi:MAG: radical SAM protein [Candidatus Thermoplasmatota archaeon]